MEDSTKFDIDPELLAGFVDEAEEELGTLDSLFVKLEAEPTNLDVINAIFRPVHTIKGNSAFFGLLKVKRLAHEIETLLGQAKMGRLVPDRSIIDILLAGVDRLKGMLDKARNGKSEIVDEAAFEEFIEKIISSKQTDEDFDSLWNELFDKFEKVKADYTKMDSSYVKQLEAVIETASQLRDRRRPDAPLSKVDQSQSKSGHETAGDDDKTEKPEQKSGDDGDRGQSKADSGAEEGKSAKEARNTMRVTEDSIDNFLGYVGELIVISEMYNHLQRTIAENGMDKLAANFRRANETFNNLSNNLQKSIMQIRKVPIRTILQKVPRLARDVAASCGKEVNIELEGEEIEVDKRLIETLDGPLTHMVRNAVDHGIEMPNDRQARGKTPQGNIRIVVKETADDVTLSISDNGKGLDFEAIKAKAVQAGQVGPDHELTQEQIVDLIFVSGVSTAEKVTDVSGRGVGMDVVKRNIADANGRITVESEPGKGSRFVIQLPKTVSTQIIDGFLFKIDDNCYVIPMDKVQEVFRPEFGDISSVVGRGECVFRHGILLSVLRPKELLGEPFSSEGRNGEEIMISTSVGTRQMALCVDEVIGVQKVVLKALNGLELKSELYSSAAVMGNGDIAMIMDLDTVNYVNHD